MRATGGANWNFIGLTDLGGHLVERYVLPPYGELTVYQETGYGDYDEDYDVMGDPPSTSDPDYTTFTGTCAGSGPTGACRILDLDFDGDVDTTDRDDHFMSLPHGVMRHPGRIATAVQQPFAHQGSLYEPEIGSYSSRHEDRTRQYSAGARRYMQPYSMSPRYIYSMTKRYEHGMNLYAHAGHNPINGGPLRGTTDEPPCNCNYWSLDVTERDFWNHSDGPMWCREDGSHDITHRCYNQITMVWPGDCAPSTHVCFPKDGDPVGQGENANFIDIYETHVDCVGWYIKGEGGECVRNEHCLCHHLGTDYYGPMPDIDIRHCTSCPAIVCPLP